jgi:hypothetical protein
MRNVEYEVSKQFRDIIYDEVRQRVSSFRMLDTTTYVRALNINQLLYCIHDSVKDQYGND